jgi:hypothetical protein
MNEETNVEKLIERNGKLIDEALQIMKHQAEQIQILVDEVRAWRAFWYTPGNMERMNPVTEAVAKTNASRILRDVPGIQGSNIQ